MSTRPRTAVVIVHGIGEARPLATLLSFVRSPSAAPVPRDGVVPATHAVYGAPDSIRGRTDQRKLKVTWNHEGGLPEWLIGLRSNNRRLVRSRGAQTDFYEFYWAYHFRDTAWRHLGTWFLPLLLGSRAKTNSVRLKGPGPRWLHVTMGVAMLALAILAFGVGADGWKGLSNPPAGAVAVLGVGLLVVASFLGLIAVVRAIVLAGLAMLMFLLGQFLAQGGNAGDFFTHLAGMGVVVVLTSLLSGFLLRGLGDAARYLTSSPDNVQESEQIRSDAVALLSALHEATDGDSSAPQYERIVVVGHSLGSVIAYDAIRHLWARTTRSIGFPAIADQGAESAAVVAVEQAAAAEDREALLAGKLALQKQVRDACTSGRPSGRWAITDLITLGSPLTYADLLLANGRHDLENRLNDRMLAKDPPVFQQSGDQAVPRMRFKEASAVTTTGSTHLHHAAPFAVVTWTNVYFRHDLVGGPVEPQFGWGVTDVELSGGYTWIGGFLLKYPHSSYWKSPGWRTRRANDRGCQESRKLLTKRIMREPEVLIVCATELNRNQLLAMAALLDARHTPSGLQVRLLIGSASQRYSGRWLCGDRRVILTPALAAELLEAAPTDTQVYVAVSPDLRPGSGTDEPDEPDEPGEEEEAELNG